MKIVHKINKTLFSVLFFISYFLCFDFLRASDSSDIELPSPQKRHKRMRAHEKPALGVPVKRRASWDGLQESGKADKGSLKNRYGFDEKLLNEDQRARLLNLSKMPEGSFDNSTFYTSRVVYSIMIGKHHDEIKDFLGLESADLIMKVRMEAYKYGYLTAKEARKSGALLKTLIRQGNLSLEEIYILYTNEIDDFTEAALSLDQKNRLKRFCEETLKEGEDGASFKFKIIYYVMSGKHHNEIKNILKLGTIQSISTTRMKAYEQGILTLEELRLSGARLEVIRRKEDLSLSLYTSYSENLDERLLTPNQKERLLKLCADSPKDLEKGLPFTFKISYYVMLGKNLEEIRKILELESDSSISSARADAFERGYLTDEEVVKSGGIIGKLKVRADIALSLHEEHFKKIIPSFDITKLSEEQRKRLKKMTLLPDDFFSRGKGTTYKVVYYIMTGVSYAEIPAYSGITDLKRIATAGRDAYWKGFLTRKELDKVGLELDNRRKNKK